MRSKRPQPADYTLPTASDMQMSGSNPEDRDRGRGEMATRQLRNELVTVFGGSGFVGRHVVRALARRGYRVLVAVRRPDLAGAVRTFGNVGQVQPIQANIRDQGSVERAVHGAAAVVNLVGILSESGRQRFAAVHAEGPERIAAAARAAGARRMVQVSAIGADAESASAYGRSKAAGEAAVRDRFPEAVVVRPSIIFGPEDSFFNRFAGMARLSPALPLIGGGHTRFQPVFVGDVAEAVARAIDGDAQSGTIYELGGPEICSFRELMELMLAETGRRRLLVPLPFGLARAMASVLQILPGAPLTVDQVEQLKRDNVVSQQAEAEGRTLGGLGIDPVAMQIVLPTYLVRFRRAGQFAL